MSPLFSTTTTGVAPTERPRRKVWLPLLAGGCCLLLASCSDDSRVPVYPVGGTVSFGREVPVGAVVVLHPADSSAATELAPMGVVGPDGRFEVGTYDDRDGAPAGTYKATFQWFKVVSNGSGSGRGPNVLPRNYADPAKSPVTVLVGEGSNEVPSVVIR
jgi:hypothetical protein